MHKGIVIFLLVLFTGCEATSVTVSDQSGLENEILGENVNSPASEDFLNDDEARASLNDLEAYLQANGYPRWQLGLEDPPTGISLPTLYDSRTGVACMCGDLNADNAVTVSDVLVLVNYMFQNGPAPEFMVCADVDTTEGLGVGDITHLVDFLFHGGDSLTCPGLDIGEAGARGEVGVQGFAPTQTCDDVVSDLPCEPLPACRSLDQGNRYYLLNQDISNPATCFELRASNVVVDLNGYTVRFAQASSGHAFLDEWSNQDNIEIKNGRLIGGPQPESHAIYFNSSGSSDLFLHDLEISVGGIQTQGIIVRGGSGLRIFQNTITMDSRKQDPCSHYGGHIRGIGLSGRSGSAEIAHNRVEGNGMFGIGVAGCGRWSENEALSIHDNYVSQWSPVRDGYAISIQSRNNACSDGSQIFHNTINQINGRGVLVAGWDSDADFGPGHVEVFKNNITVREGWDCEYNAPGTGVGIRIRFGAHHVTVRDNVITGYAGRGVAMGSEPSRDGATAFGLFVASSHAYGDGNQYLNNQVDVSTNDAALRAVAVYVEGGNINNEARYSYFHGNTFRSNNQAVRISFFDGGGGNARFEANTIARGDNPIDFRSIGLGYWAYGASGVNFVDTLTSGGASVYDLTIYPCSGSCDGYPFPRFSDIHISWNLTTVVQNTAGQPLENAQIGFRDQYGALVEFQDRAGNIYTGGSSNAEGIFVASLPERSFAGVNDAIETIRTPVTVFVTYGGLTQTREISLTTPSTETFTFGN